jgi:phenylacetic acid degradation operon negative regulatory protein
VDDQLRRRAVGPPAARSVLLTVLGEYVYPSPRGIWQETLINALVVLGYKSHAARQAVARSVTGGWLRTERRGRRSLLHLTETATSMLSAGAARIYGFGEPREWDGRWLLVVLRVPEQRREVRHQARTRLAWAGFGSLGGGVWISPHVGRQSEVRDIAQSDAVADLLTFRAEIGELGGDRALVAEAWDLQEVGEAYRAFIAAFSRQRPASASALFRQQTLLVHEWRRFPFLDPDLPERLLPRSWPRARALEVFAERHAAWHEGAQDHFRSLENVGRTVAAAPAQRPKAASQPASR